MRVLLCATTVVATLASSGCVSRPWHPDALAFAAEVKDWNLAGKPADDVLAVFDERGFRCSRPNSSSYDCVRNVASLACTQTQALSMTVDEKTRIVQSIRTHGMADDTLPWSC